MCKREAAFVLCGPLENIYVCHEHLRSYAAKHSGKWAVRLTEAAEHHCGEVHPRKIENRKQDALPGWNSVNERIPQEDETVFTAYYYARYDSWMYRVMRYKFGMFLEQNGMYDMIPHWTGDNLVDFWCKPEPPNRTQE